MNRFIRLCTFVIILSSCLLLAAEKQKTLYVSHAGSDMWSGTAASPNAQKTNGPFATFERARDAVRQAKSGGFTGTISVSVREGVYPVSHTLTLDSTLSGSAEAPILWSGYKRESVRLIGGTAVKGFAPVTDPAVIARLPLDLRTKILVADLRAQHITDYGTIPNGMNLYYKGKHMPIARYPNQGWLTIADVPQSGDSVLNPGDKKIIRNGKFAGKHYGRFGYSGDRPSLWAASGDKWMHGYFEWDWRDAYQKIARIDTAAREIYPALPHHHYGYEKDQRYYFMNILEELDAPGEWFLDAQNGLLYFLPPAPLADGDVLVSALKEPMIVLAGASNIQVRNMTFECSRTTAVKISGGTGNTLAGCTIRNIGNEPAVVIDGGTHNGVQSCDVYDVGAVAIKMSGGDRKTLAPGGNFVDNNHIHGYGMITQAFSGAVFCEGVGNRVAHNKMHDAPFSGIQYYGNEHVFEYNDIYDLAHESGDVGGINTGADYSDEGTMIRYNYIHDSHARGHGGFRAVYLDLPGSNTTIFSNVFLNVDVGVFFNSGRDNLVQNNIFVRCNPSVNIYIWPHTAIFKYGGAWRLVEKLDEVNYKNPPYSLRYPKLPKYLEGTDVGLPHGNRVVNNISYGGKWLDFSETLDFTNNTVENNLVADTTLMVVTRAWTENMDPYNIGYAATYQFGDTTMTKELERCGNVLTKRDPGFVDLKHGNLQLKNTSPAYTMGFKRIPIEKIGLMRDEFRRTLPEH